MTAFATRQLVSLLMCIGFLFALFGKSVGLPDWTEFAGAILGLVCAISAFILQRKAKRHADQIGTVTAEQRAQRRWLFVALVAIVTLSSPFWLPSTGVLLPLPQLIITALVSCVFAVAIILFATRDSHPKV